MKITINREFKVFGREVCTRFVVTVENNEKIASKTVFIGPLDYYDAVNTVFANGLNDDNYSDDRDWTEDKTFGGAISYDSIDAFNRGGGADEYHDRLLKAIKNCEQERSKK